MLPRPLFRAKFIHVALHPVGVENPPRHAETFYQSEDRLRLQTTRRLVFLPFSATDWTFVFENRYRCGSVLVQLITCVFLTHRPLSPSTPTSWNLCWSTMQECMVVFGQTPHAKFCLQVLEPHVLRSLAAPPVRSLLVSHPAHWGPIRAVGLANSMATS